MRLILLAVGSLAAICVMWAALAVAGRRLPPGVLRDAATFVPMAARAARTLLRDPRVPRRAKVAIALAVVYVICPIDLIPEFVPVVGPLDDLVVVALALRYAARRVPLEALLDAWPGDRRLLGRLVPGVVTAGTEI